VKNTNVSKFGQKGLIIRGDLCSVIVVQWVVLKTGSQARAQKKFQTSKNQITNVMRQLILKTIVVLCRPGLEPGLYALVKEKQSKTGLECPGQVNTVKNTKVSKFGQKGLIIRGDLCSVMVVQWVVLKMELRLELKKSFKHRKIKIPT